MSDPRIRKTDRERSLEINIRKLLNIKVLTYAFIAYIILLLLLNDRSNKWCTIVDWIKTMCYFHILQRQKTDVFCYALSTLKCTMDEM